MDIEALYQRAFELRCEGDYPGAQRLFQQILTSDAHHIKSRHQVALIKGFLGDFEESLSELEGLVREVPANLDVRYDLAMTQMMLGNYEDACGNLKYILERDPTHSKAIQQATYC